MSRHLPLQYAGEFRWCWQRDFFDHSNAGHIFLVMAGDGNLNETMQERMKTGARMPGWTKLETFDWYETLIDRDDL